MTTPASLDYEVVQRGGSWFPTYRLFRMEDGSPVNLAAAGVKATFRITDAADVIDTKATDVVGDFEWVTDGTDGEVKFKFSAAETLAFALGKASVEIVVEDTSTTPDTKVVWVRGLVRVEDPYTAPI